MSPVETRKITKAPSLSREISDVRRANNDLLLGGTQRFTCSYNVTNPKLQQTSKNKPHVFPILNMNLERIGSCHCCLVVVSNLQDVGTVTHRPAPRVARFVCTSGDHVRSKTTYSMLGRQVDS